MKTMIKSLSSKLVVLAIICFMASCTNSDEPAITDSKSSRIDISLAEQAIAEQSNQFAWRLLEECKGNNDENIVLSPLGANLCLSMLFNATGGNSRSQLLDALGYAEKDIETVNSLNQKLARQICGIDKNVKIALANSVWYDAQINPYPDFMNRLLDNYNIQSFCINHNTFGRDVNDWCKNNTYGLIPKIIE